MIMEKLSDLIYAVLSVALIVAAIFVYFLCKEYRNKE
jgi:hypothetical protein